MYPSITISNDAARRLAAGRLWFARSDVIGRKPNVPGIVHLIDRRGKTAGMAFVSPRSQYYLRVFSKSKQKADRSYWREKILRANDRRYSLLSMTDAYRVVHAEADGIPAVVIDRYNDIWAVQITSSGAMTIAKDLIDIIVEEFAPAAIIGKNPSLREGSDGPLAGGGIVFGDRSETVVREGDRRFEVDVLAGQKTGAYLDYRAFRFRAREFARGACLDAFCYQGWFSCQVASGADSVVAVDRSAAAIVAARRNAKINGFGNMEFVKADLLGFLKDSGDRFDFIHLDPPAFSRGRGNVAPALRGYRRLLAAALPLLASGGTVMVSACSHAITERLLEEIVMKSIDAAQLRGECVFRGIQDRDHPVLKGHPESLYLKAIAVRLKTA